MNSIYNEEGFFGIKAGLLNLMLTLPLYKLHVISLSDQIIIIIIIIIIIKC